MLGAIVIDGASHVVSTSMSNFVFEIFRFVFLTICFWWRRWRNPRGCGFPNKSLPLISFTDQLQSRERMARIAFDAENFGDYLKTFATFAQNFQSHCASYIGQLSRQMY